MFSSNTTQVSDGGYQISRSLRFNSADSAYLNRTPASAGNRRTWTFSTWVKRSQLSSGNAMLATVNGSALNYFAFGTSTGDFLAYAYFDGSTDVFGVNTSGTSVFRDVSAWYHIILAVDTTQATASNRVKIYVNNVEQTGLGGTYPTQNYDTPINNSIPNLIGGGTGSYTAYLADQYMTEINFIDGQALTPSSFGETNAQTGVWQPKAYSGSYGTNGFYLNFSDNSNTTAATLGKDYSGNGNNWTPNNFSVTAGAGNDSLVDSPTSYGTDTGVGGTVRGNYSTWNPLVKVVSQPTFTDGNLVSTAPAGWSSAVGTIGVTSGKWYWEIVNGNSDAFVGICGSNATLNTDAPQSSTGTILYYGNTGNKRIDTVDTAYGSAFSTQTIGVALDIDGGTIVFYRDNVSQGSISLSSSTLNGKTIFPLSGVISTTATVNFGQRPFAYTAPSGFKALCTQNLPTPTIGATTATLANKYFEPTLYTGTNANLTVTNSGGFQPDFIWIKLRSSAGNHVLANSIGGPNKVMYSSQTTAEETSNAGTGITAITSTGFTLGTELAGTTYGSTNYNTYAYVAWNWKANGSGSTNTAGSITSTVSANTTSGFSIVTYTGNGTNNATVGHGLGATPSMIIIKQRNAARDWPVYHVGYASAGVNDQAYLNLTNAAVGGIADIKSVGSSTFALDTWVGVNGSGNTYVAYCFAPVVGYSAFGSYTGNGSADGAFVFTGMRPAYVMIKRTSSTGDWFVYNNKTSPSNAVNLYLVANTSGAEGTYATLDFLSNGFKLRVSDAEVNGNGSTFIFMAFAEAPQKFSLAR